jgi:hypothetical protein
VTAGHAVPDTLWTTAGAPYQYQGGHDEAWGGVTVDAGRASCNATFMLH